MLLVGVWLVLGWLVGGLLATLAVVLPSREPRPTERCARSCHSLTARLGAALWGRGAERCPACGFRRRDPWPLPEVGSAAVFAALAWRFGWGLPLLAYSLLGAILVLVVCIDVRHHIIPDVLTMPFFVVALVGSSWTIGIGRASLGGAVAGGLFALLYLLARLIYRRTGALGLGDVKLALLVGTALGAPAALSFIVYAALAGGLMALALIATGRSRYHVMPYGPNLAIGALAVLLLDPGVWR